MTSDRSSGEPRTSADEEGGGSAMASERSPRHRILVSSFAMTSPIFLLALALSFGTDWHLTGDSALEVIRAGDVGVHTPHVGVYSRYGWAHPGPAVFMMFAAPAHVFANPGAAVVVVGLLFKWLVAAGGVAVVHGTFGRGPATVGAAVASLLYVHLVDGIWSVWNPALASVVLLTATLVCSLGRNAAITVPVAAVLISLMVQFHVGLLGPAVVLVAALAWRQRPSRRVAGATAAVLIVVWILPLIDLVVGTHNARDLFVFATGSERPTVGLGRALGITSRELLPIGPWSGGSEPTDFVGGVLPISTMWLALPVCALVFLGWFSHTRAPELSTLVAVLAGHSVIAVVTVAQIADSPFPYLVMWVRVVAALLWGTTAIAMSTLLPRASTLQVAASAAIAMVACISVFSAPRETFASRAVSTLELTALQHSQRGEPVHVVFSEEFPGIAEGVALTLESADRDVQLTAPPGDRLRIERMWGRHRLIDEGLATSITISRDDGIDCLEDLGWEVIAVHRERGRRAALLLWDSAVNRVMPVPGSPSCRT